MSVNFTNLGPLNSTQRINNTKQIEKTNFSQNSAQDTFEPQKSDLEKTLEQKQELIKKARKQGAGWSILGGLFTTAYYALRSDETVAKKFNLDTDKDKNLIKKIKQEQTLWSLIGGLSHVLALTTPLTLIAPAAFGGAGYLIASALDSSKINVD